VIEITNKNSHNQAYTDIFRVLILILPHTQYTTLPCWLGTLLLLGTGNRGPLLANCCAVDTALSRYGRKLWREQYCFESTHCKKGVHSAV